MNQYEIYCPACNRELVPINMAEILLGWQDCRIYKHDPVPHTEEDFDEEAMKAGLQ